MRAICAGEAADLSVLPPDTVMISIINEENRDLYPLQFEDDVLRVSFSDVIRDVVSHNGQIYRPIQPQHVIEILEFIQINLGKDFLVCAAGVSRSSAVCLFLHLIHGYSLKHDFWKVSEPNSVVLRELIVHHKRREVGIYRS